jgi:diguanylate cyclase (GGDEF)-like protein
MGQRPDPTPEVAGARIYAARSRILLALAGGTLLALDPGAYPHIVAASIGFAVIGLTGLVERFVRSARWLRYEEALSCIAVVCMVGYNEGRVDVVSLLWLVAAVTGVLARGGRVGWVGRLLVVGALFSPIVTTGTMTTENLGLAVGSILLLLAAGRISRETAELLRRARHDAAHDPLTGLLSGPAFRKQVDLLAELATRERPAAVIALDLDEFGAVNKRLGHAAGDRLLLRAGEAMQATLRGDDILGRLGGDEFAALVFTDDPQRVAERLMEAVAGEDGAQCTARAGIARVPADGTGAEALLAAADVALRVSKRSGAVHVTAYDGAPLSDEADGAQAALARLCRGEGLWIAAQPIVEIDTGRPHAYEALARFFTRGGQGPLHWFALADEFGMRAELELACLREAFELTARLPGGALLSVNLSAPLLGDPRTAELLDACPDTRKLIVEVTEETLVRQEAAAARASAELRERGIRIAVDDVGAGYSGLSQLATLRPDYLKLDRVLVRGIEADPGRAALMHALADYARDTGGLLVAEGVETPEELACVRAAGAPLVQGFLLARPGPPWPEVDPSVLPVPARALAR